MIFVFDLEGPLSPMDHAAEAMRIIGQKIGRSDFFELFQMLSLYDDELTIEKHPGYNPGDTLRLIAPIISTNLTDQELIAISETATLTPGAKDLMGKLDMDDVYVASTSYQQHAYTIAKKLGIKKENVNCTELPKYAGFPYLEDLLRIFEKYKNSGNDIKIVKKELDKLFWKSMPKDYLKTKVCGGQRKLDVVEQVAKKRGAKLSEFMVVGDSITDINMLEGVKKGKGLAISFNGNRYSAPKASIAVSSMSLMALKPLADAGDIEGFLTAWGQVQNKFKLLSPEIATYFKRSRIPLPSYDEVRKSDLAEIIKRQKEMRVAIRKEYGTLT